MLRPLMLAAILTLTACGSDGPPTPPDPERAISITGEVAIGVTGTIN